MILHSLLSMICPDHRPAQRQLVPICLSLFLMLIGCGDTGQPIVVNVSPLPASAAKLKVMASLGQRVASESYSFSIPQGEGKQEFTFSFHAPTEGGSQNLILSVVAQDGNGCSISVGANGPTSAIDSLAGIDVRLSPIEKPDCTDSSPRSLVVRPDQVSTENGNPAGNPATVRVLGWGFQPKITASFGGIPAAAVRWKSVSELEADLPSQKGTPFPLGPLSLSLVNPDGSSDSRADLLRRGFYASIGLQRVTASGLSRSPDALADLDQDGKLDLLCLDAPSKSVLVFLARPDGSFSPSATWTVSFPQTPLAVAAVDVDGDTKPDLIVGLVVPSIPPSQTPTVGVVRNLGNGMPASVYASYLVGAAPTDISGIDVNHDGKMDLVVNTRADAVSILLNQGDGSFPFVAQSYAAGGAVQSIQAADANPNYDLFHLAYIGNGGMGHEGCEGNPQRNREQRLPRTLQRTTGAA